MGAPMTEALKNEERSRAALRFTYSSGSKPLDGYTIKRGIGRGGFGEVYYAVSDAGKEVALKLIKRHLDVELRGVRQCLNLKHPHLLALHDIRTDAQDDCWVIMEFVSGESLDEVLERHPHGLPREEALEWIRGVAAGVAYLHDHGIVHRDLKPGNIFRDEGIIKLGDYGLSKFVSCSRRSGQTESVGTVHYMAPEIANGRYGKEIDTYALGILLYEVLTGRVPFEGESVGEVLMKHLTAEPDLSLVEEPLRSIVARALAKDPQKRLASAKELLALLPAPADATAGPSYFGRTASPTPTPAVVMAEVVDEEPVLRAMRAAVKQMKEEWAAMQPAARAVVATAAVFMIVMGGGIAFPVALMLGIAYSVYLVAWTLMHHKPHKPPAAVPAARVVTPPPIPVNPTPPPREKRSHSWRRDRQPLAKQDEPLAIKTSRQKLAELTGSMLLAAGVAPIMTIVVMVLRREEMLAEQFVWLALAGTLGAWAVLIPAKTWEGNREDQMTRRFAMLVVGLVWGVIAYGLAQFLAVDLPFEMRSSVPRHAETLYEPDGSPKMLVYLAYFGFLLLALRWWRQADPRRSARLSLWGTAVAVLGAWLVNLAWPFPQPWGLMLVAIMTVAVQVSSPWTPRKARPH